MARAMKETKSNKKIQKQEVLWKQMSVKQKIISVWFSMSPVLLALCAESIKLTMIAVANLAIAAYFVVKHVPLKEDE